MTQQGDKARRKTQVQPNASGAGVQLRRGRGAAPKEPPELASGARACACAMARSWNARGGGHVCACARRWATGEPPGLVQGRVSRCPDVGS